MYAFEIDKGFVFYKYRDFTGDISLDPSLLHWFWRIMEGSGLSRIVFYDGSVVNFRGFRRIAELPEQHIFLGFKNGQPAGLFWLNGFGIRTCFIHMAIMPGYHGQGTLDMGRGVLRHLLTANDVDGEYFLKNVKGLVPVTNPLACRMAERSGFHRVGILSGDAYIAARDEHVDAMLYCATLDYLSPHGAKSTLQP